MKPIDVEDNTYINTDKETNDKDPKFKVGNHVRISKYKNIFAKGYTPNWSEEVFVIKKVKNTVSWTYVINDLNGEEIMGKFYEKELQKTNEEEFRIEKVIKRKGDKMTSAICNSKQVWNKNKCRCEYKEDLINKMVCDKGYIWNPSNCACECDKLCGIGQ